MALHIFFLARFARSVFNICFSQDVKTKVALSSLQLSIIELVFVALDKGCLRWEIPIFAIRN